MLEEAINLIKKELDMYRILEENLKDDIKTLTVLKAKRSYDNKIQTLKYILKILVKQK